MMGWFECSSWKGRRGGLLSEGTLYVRSLVKAGGFCCVIFGLGIPIFFSWVCVFLSLSSCFVVAWGSVGGGRDDGK